MGGIIHALIIYGVVRIAFAAQLRAIGWADYAAIAFDTIMATVYYYWINRGIYESKMKSPARRREG